MLEVHSVSHDTMNVRARRGPVTPEVASKTVNGTPDVFYGFFEPTSFLDDRIVIVLRQLGDKRRRLRHEPDQLDTVRLP